MNSVIDICNEALSHLSVGEEIASLDERSENAQACKRFYQRALRMTLRDFPWPFATSKAERLTLVQEFNFAGGITESFGYVFSYQYPPNAARLLRVYDKYWTGRVYGYFGSGGLYDHTNRFAGGGQGYPYRIVDSEQGPLVFTDAQEARGVYTKMNFPESRFPDDFSMALSYKLAYFIGPRLARGEERILQRVKQDYMLTLSEAKANAVNEEQQEPLPDSELIRSRV